MDPLAEIRRLYYQTTAATIQGDLARAIELLKSLKTEPERERAAVYMDGLSQMRSEWAVGRKTKRHGGRQGPPAQHGQPGQPGQPSQLGRHRQHRGHGRRKP